MREPKTTIQDIARELQVTPSTVSRALNNHRSISEATKKAVSLTAQKLNYTHNRVASSLRLGKTKILGVIIPSAEINFFGSVVHGIEKVAREKGYSILIFQSNEEPEFEKQGVDTFLRSRVDGVLVSIAKETTDLSHLQEIKKRRVPLVLFDRANDCLDVPAVVVDDHAGALKATLHLIEQGCKRIAHIAGQQHVAIFRQRLDGYKAALKKAGLPVQKELIVYGDVSVSSGMECMNRLLRLPEPPDGVFAVEDFTALGALQAAKASGKKVPGDIALIGFANEAFGAYITPSLSTVDQQTIRMGEEAAHLFFDNIEQKDFYESAPEKKVLEPVLIYRSSSQRNLIPVKNENEKNSMVL
jgi:LacI family transcriptional regulator